MKVSRYAVLAASTALLLGLAVSPRYGTERRQFECSAAEQRCHEELD